MTVVKIDVMNLGMAAAKMLIQQIRLEAQSPSVERAIRLTEYFKNSAISVQNILNENMLTAQQQAIVNHLPATFTTAQAHDVAKENDMSLVTANLRISFHFCLFFSVIIYSVLKG